VTATETVSIDPAVGAVFAPRSGVRSPSPSHGVGCTTAIPVHYPLTPRSTSACEVSPGLPTVSPGRVPRPGPGKRRHVPESECITTVSRTHYNHIPVIVADLSPTRSRVTAGRSDAVVRFHRFRRTHDCSGAFTNNIQSPSKRPTTSGTTGVSTTVTRTVGSPRESSTSSAVTSSIGVVTASKPPRGVPRRRRPFRPTPGGSVWRSSATSLWSPPRSGTPRGTSRRPGRA